MVKSCKHGNITFEKKDFKKSLFFLKKPTLCGEGIRKECGIQKRIQKLTTVHVVFRSFRVAQIQLKKFKCTEQSSNKVHIEFQSSTNSTQKRQVHRAEFKKNPHRVVFKCTKKIFITLKDRGALVVSSS